MNKRSTICGCFLMIYCVIFFPLRSIMIYLLSYFWPKMLQRQFNEKKLIDFFRQNFFQKVLF